MRIKRKSKKLVGAERLLELGIYLRDVVAKKYRKNFYMGHWVGMDFSTKCGTTACAFGWATKIFPELKIAPTLHGTPTIAYERKDGTRLFGFDAAEEFFRITPQEGGNLFLDHPGHERVDVVARNIIRFARAKLKKSSGTP